jgi:hypothetical protein
MAQQTAKTLLIVGSQDPAESVQNLGSGIAKPVLGTGELSGGDCCGFSSSDKALSVLLCKKRATVKRLIFDEIRH